MTRKDYERLAYRIRDALLDDPTRDKYGYFDDGAFVVINAVANACKAENPKFKRGKFIKACGGPRPEF